MEARMKKKSKDKKQTSGGIPRGPLGDARPDAADGDEGIQGGQPPEPVEHRTMVGTVKPEDYPEKQ